MLIKALKTKLFFIAACGKDIIKHVRKLIKYKADVNNVIETKH